jgi:hypothetical protein
MRKLTDNEMCDQNSNFFKDSAGARAIDAGHRKTDHPGRIRACGPAAGRFGARFALSIVAFATALGATVPAGAQGISFGPSVPDLSPVCYSNIIFVAVNSDCDLPDALHFPTELRIGLSTGTQTTFDVDNGNAVFGGTATFNAAATFNNPATFNAGITSTTGTFSGMVTMNGGLTVASGQTVDMGGNRVQNVGTPTAGTDAANKNYVDTLHDAQQTQINQHGVRLTNVETVNTQQNTRLTALESGFANQAEQITAINNSIKSLSKRDGELADGIAIALALAQPAFQPGQKFAVRGGWGNFDGSNAFGLSAAGLMHSFRNGGSVIVDIGAGMSARHNMFAGRGGVTIGW